MSLLRSGYILLLNSGLAAGLLLLAAADLGAKNPNNFVPQKIPFGMETAAFDNICVLFGGSISAGDFFEKLQIRNTSTGVQFWRGGEIVRTFPQTLSIEIVAVPRMCNRQASDDLAPEAYAVMARLGFDIEWKSGMSMWPVKNIHAEEPKHDLEEMSLVGPGAFADVWKYKMMIDANGVPLQTHVIVSVSTKTKQHVARLAARLFE